ncbi:MAG: twin-arginine translocase subunit TatC [Bacteroidota bacterium]
MGIVTKFKDFRSNRKDRNDRKVASNGQSQEKEMSFLDHLEELRWHLMRSLAVIMIIGIGLFVNIQWFIDTVILAPFSPEFPVNKFLCDLNQSLCFDSVGVSYQAIDPYEQFLRAIGLAFFGGFIIAFPYVLWETWRFMKPGLHAHERGKLKGTVFILSVLFFIGVAFAYYVVLPFSVQFLSSFKLSEAIQNQWRIGKVISLVTQIVVAGGILFELPMMVFFFSKLGLLTPAFMRTYRRHALVILLVMAAIITPPDVLSQILIFLPLVILYEFSVMICVVVNRKRDKEIGLTTEE